MGLERRYQKIHRLQLIHLSQKPLYKNLIPKLEYKKVFETQITKTYAGSQGIYSLSKNVIKGVCALKKKILHDMLVQHFGQETKQCKFRILLKN